MKMWYESENAEMTKIKCDKWYKDCIGEISYSQPNFSSDTCLFNICTSHKKKKINSNKVILDASDIIYFKLR